MLAKVRVAQMALVVAERVRTEVPVVLPKVLALVPERAKVARRRSSASSRGSRSSSIGLRGLEGRVTSRSHRVD